MLKLDVGKLLRWRVSTGRQIPLAHQYAAVGVLTFPLLWVAGAGSMVFWVIGATFVTVLVHSVLRVLDDEPEQLFEAVVEEV